MKGHPKASTWRDHPQSWYPPNHGGCSGAQVSFAKTRTSQEKIPIPLGKWWKFMVDAAEKEYGNHLGNASNDFKHLQDRMQEERARAAKLCRQSVTHTLTREQSLALHDDLITAFLSEDCQKNLAAHWAAAKGNKAKEQKAKRELCLPLQLPVMEKYGFEKSEKGVFMCLWSVRTTFSILQIRMRWIKRCG